MKRAIPLVFAAAMSACGPRTAPTGSQAINSESGVQDRVERAATLEECRDFLARWHQSEVSPFPIEHPVALNPFDPRGAVIGHRFVDEEPFPPRLVSRVEAIDHIENWCSFGLMTTTPTRAQRGACFVDELDRCWYALRRKGNDFYVAGYFGAMDDRDDAGTQVERWLDVVDSVFGVAR